MHGALSAIPSNRYPGEYTPVHVHVHEDPKYSKEDESFQFPSGVTKRARVWLADNSDHGEQQIIHKRDKVV